MSTDSKISVVTVVKNQKDKLPITINSVLNQSYKNLEYIIIDGASSDGSVDLIKSLINKKVKFISEKDNGLYFAMNKAIDLASGEYIIFMNAGDYFFNNTCIESIFKDTQDAAVIYGNTEIIYDKKNTKILNIKNHSHKYHHNFIHQSSFTRIDIMKKFKFDTSYKIAADTNFFTTIFNEGHNFLYINKIISCFDASGISSNISFRIFYEDLKIGQKYNKLFFISHIAKYIFSLIPRMIIKKLMPKKILNKGRKLFSQKNL